MIITSILFIAGCFGFSIWMGYDLLNETEIVTDVIEDGQSHTTEILNVNPATPSRLIIRAVVNVPLHTEQVFSKGYVLPASYEVMDAAGNILHARNSELTRPHEKLYGTDSEMALIGTHYLDYFRVPGHEKIRVSLRIGEVQPGSATLENIGFTLMDNTRPQIVKMIGIFTTAFGVWALWIGKILWVAIKKKAAGRLQETTLDK